jgi:hypothetical protein
MSLLPAVRCMSRVLTSVFACVCRYDGPQIVVVVVGQIAWTRRCPSLVAVGRDGSDDVASALELALGHRLLPELQRLVAQYAVTCFRFCADWLGRDTFVSNADGHGFGSAIASIPQPSDWCVGMCPRPLCETARGFRPPLIVRWRIQHMRGRAATYGVAYRGATLSPGAFGVDAGAIGLYVNDGIQWTVYTANKPMDGHLSWRVDVKWPPCEPIEFEADCGTDTLTIRVEYNPNTKVAGQGQGQQKKKARGPFAAVQRLHWQVKVPRLASAHIYCALTEDSREAE